MEPKSYARHPYHAPSKTLFFIHLIVYVIAMLILWLVVYRNHDAQLQGDAYPWEGWFTGTWFLVVVAHFCNTFFDNNKDNQDKYYLKYLWEKEH
jgi:hypothetical protein